VDISFSVCNFVCLFVRLRISPPTINLVASNFAQLFIGVHGRESLIFVNFASSEAQNWRARGPCTPECKHWRRDAPT